MSEQRGWRAAVWTWGFQAAGTVGRGLNRGPAGQRVRAEERPGSAYG